MPNWAVEIVKSMVFGVGLLFIYAVTLAVVVEKLPEWFPVRAERRLYSLFLRPAILTAGCLLLLCATLFLVYFAGLGGRWFMVDSMEERPYFRTLVR